MADDQNIHGGFPGRQKRGTGNLEISTSENSENLFNLQSAL